METAFIPPGKIKMTSFQDENMENTAQVKL